MNDQVQAQRQREFTAKAGAELFDLLTYELPDELKRRVVFQRCPHCGRRPELIKRRALTFHVQLRAYSPQTVEVHGYELLPCCSAMYAPDRTQTAVSKIQLRRLREGAARELKKSQKPGV